MNTKTTAYLYLSGYSRAFANPLLLPRGWCRTTEAATSEGRTTEGRTTEVVLAEMERLEGERLKLNDEMLNDWRLARCAFFGGGGLFSYFSVWSLFGANGFAFLVKCLASLYDICLKRKPSQDQYQSSASRDWLSR